MAKALSDLTKKTGKQMLFSLCQWGRVRSKLAIRFSMAQLLMELDQEEPWLWARKLGHTWRVRGLHPYLSLVRLLTYCHRLPTILVRLVAL